MAQTVKSTVFWDVVLCYLQKFIDVSEEHSASFLGSESKPSKHNSSVLCLLLTGLHFDGSNTFL
jgi:hypothetical protein